MKSLVKYLNRHLKMCVFTVVLLTLVLAGCSGTIGGGNQDEPNKTDPKPTELDFRIEKTGMSYCVINWNWLSGYSFKKVEVSTTEDFSSDCKETDFSFRRESSLPFEIKELKPGTDYYVRLIGSSSESGDFEKVLSFHTSDKGPLDNIKIEYDDDKKCVEFSYYYVRDVAKIKFIKVYRKTQTDAEWALIKEGSVKVTEFWDGFEDYEYTPNVENFYKIELYDENGNNLGADVTSELSITPEDEDDNLGIKVVKQGYSYLDLIWDYSLYDSYKITYSTGVNSKGEKAEDSVEYAGNNLPADKAVHFYFPKELFRTNFSTNVVFNIECYKNGTLEKTVKRNFEINKTGEPEDLSTELGDDKITLRWNSYDTSNNAIAKVYRRIDTSADYELIDTKKYFSRSSSDEFEVYEDKTFVAGTIN